VSVIQSVIAAANAMSPVRAARIAAGPLAGAFLKLSRRRHQMPPPPSGVQPARSRALIAASAGRVERPASGPARCTASPNQAMSS
jgi:hypothetical protein